MTDVEEVHRPPSLDRDWNFGMSAEVTRRESMTRMKSVAPPRRDKTAADESVKAAPRTIESVQESVRKTVNEKSDVKKAGGFRWFRRRVRKR